MSILCPPAHTGGQQEVILSGERGEAANVRRVLQAIGTKQHSGRVVPSVRYIKPVSGTAQHVRCLSDENPREDICSQFSVVLHRAPVPLLR